MLYDLRGTCKICSVLYDSYNNLAQLCNTIYYNAEFYIKQQRH